MLLYTVKGWVGPSVEMSAKDDDGVLFKDGNGSFGRGPVGVLGGPEAENPLTKKSRHVARNKIAYNLIAPGEQFNHSTTLSRIRTWLSSLKGVKAQKLRPC